MNFKKITEELSYSIEELKYIPYRIKRFFLKIWKIFQYIPLLWKDEDWDFAYILYLLRYKIKRTSKYIEKSNILAESEINKIKSATNEVVEHIDNYLNPIEAYDRKHGKLSFSVGHKGIPSTDNSNFYQMIWINKETGEELTEEEDKAYSERCLVYNKFEQDEWNAIFNTIKEHGQEWWE